MMLRAFLASLLSLQLGLASYAHAGSCSDDLTAVDKALRSQYGADRTWKNILACPIVLDGELRKDAIVNKTQIKEISYFRNIAYMQLNRGDEQMCRESLKKPKRLLRVW
jgi:hypothetical protein